MRVLLLDGESRRACQILSFHIIHLFIFGGNDIIYDQSTQRKMNDLYWSAKSHFDRSRGELIGVVCVNCLTSLFYPTNLRPERGI